MRKSIWIFFLLLLTTTVEGKIELPAMVGDNMVLQRDTIVKLWGGAVPNIMVDIDCTWLDDRVTVVADKMGRWEAEIKTPQAGGPYKITISDGEDTAVLENVLIGDVWFCSGQSNMEMPMKGFLSQPIEGALKEILNAPEQTNLRFFTVARNATSEKATDCVGKWQQATTESVANLSAVAYFFSKQISATLDIPIGVIVSSWGGSSILAWLPKEKILNTIDENKMVEMVEKDKRSHKQPSLLYNGMIEPTINYAIKGFLWYQGETNLRFPNDYILLKCELVRYWREIWGDTENRLPFYFAQIAPFDYKDARKIARPLFVEAQKTSEENIANCYMATTTDIGDEKCIHPSQKREIADRFAALALKHTYKMGGIEANYPQVDKVEYEKDKAYVYMKSNIGITPSNIEGFEIAGKDKVFYPAEANVKSKTSMIVVCSPKVKEPVAIRYAFRNYISANMANTMGIAAPSFRTDSWD